MRQTIDDVDAGENHSTRQKYQIFLSLAGFNHWINQ